MSPEMARLYLKLMKGEEINYDKDLVSYSSDFYTLGILSLELLNGSPPEGYFKPDDDKEQYLKKII
jgi:serine/threonine protein kinase